MKLPQNQMAVAQVLLDANPQQIPMLLDLVDNSSTSDLLKQNKKGFNAYHCLHQMKLRIPSQKLTEEALCSLGQEDLPLFWCIADTPNINEVPVDLYTEKTLTLTNKHKETTFQRLVELGQARRIPEHYLTDDNILREDNNGCNALHYAVPAAKQGHIPPQFMLTTERLQFRDVEGSTIYHR